MSRLAFVGLVALVAVLPAVGQNEAPQMRPVRFGQPLPIGFQPVGAQPAGPYVAPKADGPVVELLDEGIAPLLPQLHNDHGGEQGTVIREDRDVFAGVEAARVSPMQRFSSRIPGWNFRIVETPKNAGEFRYLRFAWKKIGGSGLMIQLHDNAKSWFLRYYCGRNVFNWQPATSVSEKLPSEWELVTRDLFKEGGAFNLTGIALTSFDGTAGLFDHIMLGRTIEDLDAATNAALGKVKDPKPLAGKDRDTAWADMTGLDSKKAAAALRQFLATAPEQVAFIRDRLADVPDPEGAGKVHKLIVDLDSDNFDTRQNATDELIKLGAVATDPLRETLTSSQSDEVRYRARLILKKLGGGAVGVLPVAKSARLTRAVRVLERAATPEARTLLGEIAAGKVAAECAADAKAALARMPK